MNKYLKKLKQLNKSSKNNNKCIKKTIVNK